MVVVGGSNASSNIAVAAVIAWPGVICVGSALGTLCRALITGSVAQGRHPVAQQALDSHDANDGEDDGGMHDVQAAYVSRREPPSVWARGGICVPKPKCGTAVYAQTALPTGLAAVAAALQGGKHAKPLCLPSASFSSEGDEVATNVWPAHSIGVLMYFSQISSRMPSSLRVQECREARRHSRHGQLGRHAGCLVHAWGGGWPARSLLAH